MFNNFYGKTKSGEVLEYDQFMTVGKDKKWDYDKIDDSSLRIFNPTTNDTILIVGMSELNGYFNNEIDIDIDDCWEFMTEFVSGCCLQVISDYYNNI